uniref:Phospholipase-like protein n=1 Tax=Tanacetum cinerariifolium TaxID=118510 RepID=A0A6L2KZ78_TANCI|nr:phospholipase-like protein [Tanacetum cinerariifolium]
MDLSGYEVPRVHITCRSRQVEVEGDGNKNVPLYYDITDKVQIQFGREEFCLVTGLRFEVENLAGYNDCQLPIPFRRRVFSSCYDGEHITGYTILEIIEGGDVFDRLHDEDDVNLCCLGILQLVLLGVEAKCRIPDWMLRLANDRVELLLGRKKGKFMGSMVYDFFHGNLPAARLRPDETEARSNWWISSRAYFDGGVHRVVPLHSRHIQTVAPSSILSTTPYWQPAFLSHPGGYNWQSPIPSQMGNPKLQPPIERHHDVAGLFNQANLSPLNLGNAFDDENEGGDDVKREHYVTLPEFLNDPKQIYLDCYIKVYLVPVTFWQQLVPHLCMPDIDSRTPMGWLSEEIEFLIRYMSDNDPWKVAYTNTVTGVIDLTNAHVYVFDSLLNKGRRNLLWNQIQRWIPVVNNILQGRGGVDGVGEKNGVDEVPGDKLRVDEASGELIS